MPERQTRASQSTVKTESVPGPIVGYLPSGTRWTTGPEGIEKTSQKLPGIASSMASELCELARRRRK